MIRLVRRVAAVGEVAFLNQHGLQRAPADYDAAVRHNFHEAEQDAEDWLKLRSHVFFINS